MPKSDVLLTVAVIAAMAVAGYYFVFQHCPGEYYYQTYSKEYIDKCCADSGDGMLRCTTAGVHAASGLNCSEVEMFVIRRSCN